MPLRDVSAHPAGNSPRSGDRVKATRRAFLRTSASAGAGLSIAFRLPELAKAAPVFEPNAYVRIAPEGIAFWMTRSEMGQGVRTLLATVLAEELEVDPESITLDQAVPGAKFKGIRLRT